MAGPILTIKVLTEEELSLALRVPVGQIPPPAVRVRRNDLLYALLCGVGVTLAVPCQVMPKEDRDEVL